MAEKRVTVGTTRVQVVAQNMDRSNLVIFNRAGAELFWSRDKTLTTANAMPLPIGANMSFKESDGDDAKSALYALVAAGTTDIGVAESFESIPMEVLLRKLEARS